jgi:hypothetical protein
MWTLVASNAAVIIWAIVETWSAAHVIWAYMGQSICIGSLWFIKILTLREFSVKPAAHSVDAFERWQPTTKGEAAVGFLAVFYVFHGAYFIALKMGFGLEITLDSLYAVGLFLLNHSFSFVYNRKWQEREKPNIYKLTSFPFIRVLVMHVTVIVMGFLQFLPFLLFATLPLFMLLKTAGDILLHQQEQVGFGDETVSWWQRLCTKKPPAGPE